MRGLHKPRRSTTQLCHSYAQIFQVLSRCCGFASGKAQVLWSLLMKNNYVFPFFSIHSSSDSWIKKT